MNNPEQIAKEAIDEVIGQLIDSVVKNTGISRSEVKILIREALFSNVPA